MATQQKTANVPLLQRLAGMQPDQFVQWIEEQMDVLNTLNDTVKKQITDGRIDTIQGAALVSCHAGELFGYSNFHGEPSPAALLGVYGYNSGGGR